MSDLYEADFGTAFYRSKDPIKNLKIKLHLERVTSASIIPQAQLEEEQGGNVEMQDVRARQNFGGQRDTEDYVFRWQEKVLGQREINLYSNADNCQTVLERKYNEDANLFQEVGRPTNRLFSYVDYDSYTNLDSNMRKMTSSPNEEQTPMAEKMGQLRHRRAGGGRVQDFRSRGLVPKMNVVDLDPNEDLKKQNRLLSTPVQTMYIMVDLSPESKDPLDQDEFVLCTIKVDANGVMSIRPDFNKGHKAYKVEAAGMGRDLFEYTIEHSSVQLNRQEEEREKKMYRELYGRHSEFLSACVGHDFEQPPVDTLRLLVYGEIVSAKNFEFDSLYVNYFVELPTGWYAAGGQQLSGVTQTCTTKVIGRDEVAYFSFPMHFELVYKPGLSAEQEDDSLGRWPILFVEVLSLDSWQRFRTEGYGHLTLPSSAGSSKVEINCWRPLGRSFVSESRRFFIGGNPELEDPTYCAMPTTFEGTHMSKFGFRTVSTGTVNVNMNIIQQSQSFVHVASSKKKLGTIMDRLGKSAAQINIMNVLDAFQRAKNRMVAARDNLKKDYVDKFETLKALDGDE